MRKFLLLFACILSMHVLAQEKFRITLNSGSPLEFNVRDIKDVSFFDEDEPLRLRGEWLCVEEENGVFESFEFLEDGYLKYHYYLISLHNGGTLGGTFSYKNGVIKMNFDSALLSQITNVVTSYSETNYVVTSVQGNSTYYKIQNTYEMTMADEPISIGKEGDVITFADNAVVGLLDNKIKPLAEGIGYVLVQDSELNETVAYRINVSYAPIAVVDFTKYFKKTKEEIISEFGNDYNSQSESGHELITYQSGYNADVSWISFDIDTKSNKVVSVSTEFRGHDQIMNYDQHISKQYILWEERTTEQEKNYLDTNDKTTATVSITVKFTPLMQILYNDLSE